MHSEVLGFGGKQWEVFRGGEESVEGQNRSFGEIGEQKRVG